MPEARRARLARPQLIARLTALAGEDGWSAYRARAADVALDRAGLATEDAERLAAAAAGSTTGAALFVTGDAVTVVVPPFPFERDVDAACIDPAPLVELLERRRAIAVFLLRLGGFTVGFFRGDSLVDSKTDRRFVKNRHRKGGQSQRRFERIREKQIDELYGKACETARETLAPYEAEVQHVFFGGHRGTLQAFRKRCAWFDRFGERLMPRVLPVAGDPRRASLDAVPREVWSSDVWTADRAGGRGIALAPST